MILQSQNKQRKYKTGKLLPLIENAIIKTLSKEKVNVFLETNEIEPVLSLIFVNEKEMKKLNSEFRCIDSVTDVLSFPQIDTVKVISKVSSEDIFVDENGRKKVLLGDIVICPEKAEKQAIGLGQTLEYEIVFLSVHSVLHLLGYDHIASKDEIKMIKRQKDIMNEIGTEQNKRGIMIDTNNINQKRIPFRSGYAAIIGRPNVGKSLLLNKLSGIRVAIVSPKPQTTRHNIRAILDEPDAQIIFVDTPGMHKPKTKLGEYMVDCAYNALNDADILILMIDATSPKITETEKNCCEIALKFKKQIILLINKVDLIPKEDLLPIIERYTKLYEFDAIIPISARTKDGLEILKEEIIIRLPEGPRYFPIDSITDQTERTIVSELIREQLLLLTSDEIPHGTAVEIESFEERYNPADVNVSDKGAYTEEDDITDKEIELEDDQETRNFVRINAVIYCDKESHKRILIGKNGEMIKRIGSRARMQIEQMLQCKVYIELFVKVREDWRNNIPILGNLGYKK